MSLQIVLSHLHPQLRLQWRQCRYFAVEQLTTALAVEILKISDRKTDIKDTTMLVIDVHPSAHRLRSMIAIDVVPAQADRVERGQQGKRIEGTIDIVTWNYSTTGPIGGADCTENTEKKATIEREGESEVTTKE